MTPEGGNGCPCGRSHPAQGEGRRPTRPSPAFDGKTTQRVYEAWVAGKASVDLKARSAEVSYSGDCEKPLRIAQGTFDYRRVFWNTRCRKCPACLRAKTRYWALAATEQTRRAAEQGRRTWFGTLTLSPEAVAMIQARAFAQWAEGQAGAAVTPPEWWDDPRCDFRFGLMREQLVGECQRYWKRLRKAGHRFKYFLVFERHKSGEPHMHWLLHEEGERILKRDLASQWPHGFTKVKLVGGNSHQNASPERVAWYVAKYLGKTVQARQIASRLYRPSRMMQDVQRKRSKP